MAPISLTLRSRSDAAVGSPLHINVVAVTMLLLSIGAGLYAWRTTGNYATSIVLTIVGIILAQSPKVAQQWERAVVLRLGRFVGLRGPGCSG